MLFLVNPKQKGKRRMARKKSKATPAQRRALKKARAALAKKRNTRKRAGKKAAATRRKRTTVKKRTYKRRASTARKNTPKRRRTRTVAKRRTKRRTARRNPARRRIKGVRRIRRKIYTRNPPVTLKNMGKVLQQGLFDATGVLAGKVSARFVSGFIPSFGEGPIMNFAKQGIAALAVGFIGGQFLPRDYSRFLIAGALSAPVETFLQGLPVVGDLVSGQAELGEAMGYGLPMGEGADYDLPIGEYVQPEIAPMGEYVEQYV